MSRCVVYQSGGFTNYGINYRKCSQEELAEMENRAMTENEAIEELKYDCNELGKTIPCDTSWGKSFENAYAMAINALEEVQQYRKHGITVESALDNMCDLAAAENLIEEYRAIGTPEECRAAMEKQIPYKPRKERLIMGVGRCKCGVEFLDKGTNFCGNCGQKLDWDRRANDETN